MKQISFCITCMNRLKHLQETLEKNILDNFLVDEVEFVVLDYLSSTYKCNFLGADNKQ